MATETEEERSGVVRRQTTTVDFGFSRSVKKLHKKHRWWRLTNARLMRWDLTCSILLVIVAFLTPFEVGFMTPVTFGVLWWFNVGVTCFFFLDMLLQFYMPFMETTRYGKRWVYDSQRIAYHYLRRRFILDFLSVLPFEFLIIDLGPRGHLLGLVKLLKLFRLRQGARVLNRWQTASIGLSFRKTMLTALFVGVLVAAHWIACMLGLVSRLQNERWECWQDEDTGCRATWLSDPLAEEESFQTPVSVRAYSFAIHNSISILVHPHLYAPRNCVERYVFAMTVLCGGFLWTQVISRSTAVVQSLTQHSMHHQQTMDDLASISKRLNLSKEIRVRLRKFFHGSHNRSEYKAWQDMIARMSPQLRRDTHREVNLYWVHKINILQGTPLTLMTDIAEELDMQTFCEQECFGEPWAMFLVVQGTAARKHCKMATMGSVWGQDHLLLSCADLLEDNLAVAFTTTTVQVLRKKDFCRIVANYPRTRRHFRRLTIKYAIIRGVPRLARRLLCDEGEQTMDSSDSMESKQTSDKEQISLVHDSVVAQKRYYKAVRSFSPAVYNQASHSFSEEHRDRRSMSAHTFAVQTSPFDSSPKDSRGRRRSGAFTIPTCLFDQPQQAFVRTVSDESATASHKVSRRDIVKKQEAIEDRLTWQFKELCDRMDVLAQRQETMEDLLIELARGKSQPLPQWASEDTKPGLPQPPSSVSQSTSSVSVDSTAWEKPERHHTLGQALQHTRQTSDEKAPLRSTSLSKATTLNGHEAAGPRQGRMCI